MRPHADSVHSPPFECDRTSVIEKRWLAAPCMRWPVERWMNSPMTTSFGSRKRASKMDRNCREKLFQ
jgi:hypothetical protein